MINSLTTWGEKAQNTLKEGAQGKDRALYIVGAVALLALATFLTVSMINGMKIVSMYGLHTHIPSFWNFLTGLEKFNVVIACGLPLFIPLAIGSSVAAFTILIPAIRYREPQISNTAKNQGGLL